MQREATLYPECLIYGASARHFIFVQKEIAAYTCRGTAEVLDISWGPAWPRES